MTAEELIYEPYIAVDSVEEIPVKISTMRIRVTRVRQDRDWAIFYGVDEGLVVANGRVIPLPFPEREKIEVNQGKASKQARELIEVAKELVGAGDISLDMELYKTRKGQFIQVMFLNVGEKREFIARTPLFKMEEVM